MKSNAIKAVLVTLIILLAVISLGTTKTYATTLVPEDNQKIEYRAVELKETNGNKQLIVEVWIRNLNFKAIDLRLQYDTSLLNTSNLTTNEIIDVNDYDGIPSNFQFENNFVQYMDMFAVSTTSGELRTIYSLLSDEERTGTDSYLVEDGTATGYVQITEPALIGRCSFQVGEGEITETALSLKTGSTSPTTGIKVNIDGTDNYQEQSLFEFTLELASKNAYLSDLQTDLIEITDFKKETLEYKIELLEEKDKIVVKPTPEDEKATVTIGEDKVDIKNGYEIKLNSLGEDTEVKILVTAEDSKYTKEYILTIKRPAGTLKGQVNISATSTTTGKHIAQIRIFKSEDVAAILDWEEVKANFAKKSSDDLHSQLGTLTEYKILTTKEEDGTYEIKLPPGKYDVLIDKPGYLDHIYTNIEIKDAEEVDKETKNLYAGDINKDGAVQIKDKALVTQSNGKKEEDAQYTEDCDVNNDGKINLYDKAITTQNNGKKREIE